MSTESSEMCNYKVRNINSVLLIYTDSEVYISQTFLGMEILHLKIVQQSRQVFVTGVGHDTVKFNATVLV